MEVIKQPKPDRVEFDRHLQRLQALQELRSETAMWRDKVDVHIDTHGKPFFYFMPTADWHLGAQGCDMEALSEHLGYIKSHVHTALVGDLGDFFSPTQHPDGMMGDVITSDDQLLLLRRFMEQYQDRILATVQDDSHTDWVRQSAGIEPYRWMTEDLGIPMLNNGGLLTMTVNNERYTASLYHDIARYNSSFNRTHALKRMRELDRPADIVVGGHRHIGAMEKAVHQEGKPVFVQMGTFKTIDDYGIRRGMIPAPQVFYPTLFLDGRRHNVEMIEDMETAREFIDAVEWRFRDVGKVREI
jgi:isochorismate hydrolase